MKTRVNGISDDDLVGGFNEAGHESRLDIVNNPSHYTVGGYEALDVIKAKLSPDEWRGAMKFNVLKYLMRANYKDNHDQDCEKAQFYIKELCNALESKEVKCPAHWRNAKQVREEDSRDPPF